METFVSTASVVVTNAKSRDNHHLKMIDMTDAVMSINSSPPFIPKWSNNEAPINSNHPKTTQPTNGNSTNAKGTSPIRFSTTPTQ